MDLFPYAGKTGVCAFCGDSTVGQPVVAIPVGKQTVKVLLSRLGDAITAASMRRKPSE